MRLIVDCRVKSLVAVHRVGASAQGERQWHEIAVGNTGWHHNIELVQPDEVGRQAVILRRRRADPAEIELKRQGQGVQLL